MTYELHTAMWDDVETGSIWISAPILTSRSIVRVRHPGTNRVVYCEVKMVDGFFLRRFVEQAGQSIEDAAKSVFMSAWYRRQLGLVSMDGQVELEIEGAESFIGRVRACLHHPQVVVRIATKLGLWSVALGLIGIALGIVSLIPKRPGKSPEPAPPAVTPRAVDSTHD